MDLIFKDQVVKGKTEFVDQHVTKIGYISLFPFLTGALDEKPFEVSDLEDENLFSQEERTKLKELRAALFPASAREQVKEVRRKIVEIMMDPDLLMSEDGIRSLSISD